MDFYKELGITRDVASRADTSYYALRGLLSVEYYYQQQEIGKITADTPTCDLPGFVYDTTENGFYRFKNTAYVPGRHLYFLPHQSAHACTGALQQAN